MKKTTILAIMAIAFCTSMQAETKKERKDLANIIFSEQSLCFNTAQHGMTPMSINLSLGVEAVKDLSFLFNWNPTLGLFNPKGESKTFFWSPDVIGGSVSYRVLGKDSHTKMKNIFGKMAIDLRASVNTTLSAHTMKFTSYEIGLYQYARKKGTRSVSGIGIKRINYHTPGLKDSYNLFLSIGL